MRSVGCWRFPEVRLARAVPWQSASRCLYERRNGRGFCRTHSRLKTRAARFETGRGTTSFTLRVLIIWTARCKPAKRRDALDSDGKLPCYHFLMCCTSCRGLITFCLVLALLTSLEDSATADTATADVANGRKGTFELLTYNVAGLPEGLSSSNPLANLPLIGKLLNKYDIALVQEDFAYPLELRQKILHGHASPAFVRGNRLDFGDGLSQFARFPFSAFRRVPWLSCHGVFDAFFDCLTPKGFTVARQSLAEGVVLHVYNLHMDAGWSSGDKAARRKQVAQLIGAIRRESAGHALIVGGDTNILRQDEGLLEQLLSEAQLKDACAEVRCSEPGRIDRVLYRSSPELLLGVRKWRVDHAFVDARGRPLSDHLPVAVAFDWERRLDAGRSASRATPTMPAPAQTRGRPGELVHITTPAPRPVPPR